MKIAAFNIQKFGTSKVSDPDVLAILVQNVMILGDFNADGAYVSKREMRSLRIRTDPNFHWLIADDVDTTASTANDHTYDRIVVYGKDMLEAVVPNSAKPFNFQKEYGLSEQQALKVSDHYPVEVELKSSVQMTKDAVDKTPITPARLVAVAALVRTIRTPGGSGSGSGSRTSSHRLLVSAKKPSGATT
ncbi:hypothetical protein NHX12_030123 [Muraenolepis orangiensis]|uniref:Uncharacterized protein n=1 Tax=Muraenolepis orangiensis TaxID=630683 RepID=A0A9Q0ILE6_9TELE|nr:hypothetical protein NHX12_030123 [Muraenolepis orangiensis]